MGRKLRATLLFLAVAAAGSAREPRPDLKINRLFADGMVLQRDVRCPVWGTAAPGEAIRVSIAGQAQVTHAGADGRWSLSLDPLPAGGPHELAVNERVLRDVMVGEVWLAAGGPNMDMPLKAAQIGKSEADDGPVSMLRFFVVPRRDSDDPERDLEDGAWRSNRSETVSEVSAVAYFFARELRRRLGVPVGILQASSETGVSEDWISKRGLASNPSLREFAVSYSMNQANYNIAHARYLGSLRDAEEARRRGLPAPPVLPKPPRPGATSGFYNGMIAPIQPYGLRGAIWYQGESEFWRGVRYRKLLAGLIQSWRAEWATGAFPFGFVQLSGLGPRNDIPEESALPRFRDSQFQTLQVENTGMAVTVDLGDGSTDRPRNKEEVGRRLALWAEARAYGRPDLVYSGPLYDSMHIERDGVRIRFKNVGGGLKAVGEKLTGFSMSSDFRKFFWAKAVIEGDTVVVKSDDIRWPAAVRYAWSDNPECNLFNQEGLPASPFRTDDW